MSEDEDYLGRQNHGQAPDFWWTKAIWKAAKGPAGPAGSGCLFSTFLFMGGMGALPAGVLFILGLVGLMVRRNVVFMLISVEIMLNAAGLAFVVAGARWGKADGQVMFLFILAMAAAEVAVGLALVLRIFGQNKTLDIDAANALASSVSAGVQEPAIAQASEAIVAPTDAQTKSPDESATQGGD